MSSWQAAKGMAEYSLYVEAVTTSSIVVPDSVIIKVY